MVTVHEVVSFLLHHFLDSGGGVGESGDDGFDVVSLLHRHDSHLVLLVDPDVEVFVVVFKDT